jgi:hypothetical protein
MSLPAGAPRLQKEARGQLIIILISNYHVDNNARIK